MTPANKIWKRDFGLEFIIKRNTTPIQEAMSTPSRPWAEPSRKVSFPQLLAGMKPGPTWHIPEPRKAIVACFDVEGFCELCSQDEPHAAELAARLIIHLHRIQDQLIAAWPPSYGPTVFSRLGYIKMVGDGGILIWWKNEPGDDLPAFDCWAVTLMRRLQQNLVMEFNEILPMAWCPTKPPRRIRVGMAAGPVYSVTTTTDHKEPEYIGNCINLAARLQGAASEVGFLVDESVRPCRLDQVIKMTAVKLKSYPARPVWIFEKDWKDCLAVDGDGKVQERLAGEFSPRP